MGYLTGHGTWAMVQWDAVGRIALSWVISPILGRIAAFLLYLLVKKTVFSYNEKAAEKLRVIKEE